jgi:hypothetical protein
MLKDNTTGEILKVGKSETGTFVGRFEKYQTAGTKTGRDLVADVLTIDKTNSHTLEAVENQARQNLEKLGHTLPWDNTKGRLGRPGPGVPFTRLNKSLREKYKWDAHGNLVKKCK